MVDDLGFQLALRAHLLDLVVCTTGSTSLSVTSTGYARASGSFISDGFAVGMEVTASGFSKPANNGTALITALTATTMTVTPYTVTAGPGGYTFASRSLSAESAAIGRTLAVGVPVFRAWENVHFEPRPEIPFVEEMYTPGPVQQTTVGRFGELEPRPLYALHVCVAEGKGIGAARGYSQAVREHFTGRTAITTADGDVLRVMSRPGPMVGQMTRKRPGFVTIPVTIPLWSRVASTV